MASIARDFELSFPAQVRALREGESASRTLRVEVGSKDAKNLNKHLAKLRNTINQTVSKMRATSGSNFRVESGVCLTDDRSAALAVVAVTHMGDIEETVDI